MSDAASTSHHLATEASSADGQAFPPAARKAWKSPKVIVGSLARANGAIISGTQPNDGIIYYIS